MARYRDPTRAIIALAAAALVVNLVFWGFVIWAIVQTVQWLTTK